MQLLLQTSARDLDAWKTAFDARAEDITGAGLTTLQIWRGEDATILVLFEVHNRERATDWLGRQVALGTALTAQFLETL
ncbi:hypothetical protein [Gemmobacter nectariphilus]|uniref:hypothetical protein n=1 Tax=Gemmobacter nectariphilus TaxID=220343 RepID=UPI0004050234|nr:hypothetical protein [Gemmobacter nectariphilus]